MCGRHVVFLRIRFLQQLDLSRVIQIVSDDARHQRQASRQSAGRALQPRWGEPGDRLAQPAMAVDEQAQVGPPRVRVGLRAREPVGPLERKRPALAHRQPATDDVLQ